ncbi:FxsA family protein [Brachybacterium sp. JHP9]|uniref:FxsA family protein n=1 Tax=Brachybacterium equifaecis TaxID=2910770 RepID=A0ABT0R2I1_9MICO|nr:FxsA family protein [Brachybacterium equifaecis]
MSTTPQPSDRPSRRGALLPLGVLALGAAELAILIWIGMSTSVWWALLIVGIGWIIGAALVITAGQQSFTRLRSLVRAARGAGSVEDHLSRPVFTLLSALLFFFPGILTDLAGLVLLLVPVQRRAVRSMGLASGSGAANRVLYRREAGGVIDGEIVIGPASGSGSSAAEPPRSAPTITQD